MSSSPDPIIAPLPITLLPFEPHQINEIKQLLSLFCPIRILVPWQREEKHLIKDAGEYIQIIYPPEDMDPGKNFHSLLTEYRNWMGTHGDRGVAEYLKYWDQINEEGESIWEIKSFLIKGGTNIRKPEEDLPLKWHMILHLALELNKQIQEVETTIEHLKRADQLLRGAVEDEKEIMGILRDIPLRGPDTIIPIDQLKRIIGACNGLFTEEMKNAKVFFVNDPKIAGQILEFITEFLLEDEEPPCDDMVLKWPDLSQLSFDDIIEARKLLFTQEPTKDLIRQIWEYPKTGQKHIEEIRKIINQLTEYIPDKFKSSIIEYHMRYLPHVKPNKDDPLLIFQDTWLIEKRDVLK